MGNKIKILVIALIFMVNVHNVLSQEINDRKDFGIFLGLGLTDGNDYAGDLKYTLNGDISGYLGWINIDAGLQFNIIENIYFCPRVRWMAGRVSTVIEGFEYAPNKKVNSVFLLGGFLNYYIFGDLYCQVSASRISTKSGFDNLVYEPDGIETGLAIGYEFWINSRTLAIELGYTSVPVRTGNAGDNWYFYEIENVSKKSNYGGIFFNIKSTFQLGDYN